MSLTITLPNKDFYPLAYKPVYDVTTSVTEDASHQNVRIRASINVDGEVIAIMEQPKGLSLFDLRPVLDSIAGKFKADLGSSTKIFSALLNYTNLTTSWTNSGFTNFSGSSYGFSADTVASGTAWGRSNSFSGTKGDVIVFIPAIDVLWVNDYGKIRLTTSTTPDTGVVYENDHHDTGTHSIRMNYFILDQDYANLYLWIGGSSAATFEVDNGSGFRVYRINAGETAQKGRPCVYYKVAFQTYYEDASNITQTPADELETPQTLLYVPAKVVNDDAFSDYVMNDGNYLTGSKFLTESLVPTTGTPPQVQPKYNCPKQQEMQNFVGKRNYLQQIERQQA